MTFNDTHFNFSEEADRLEQQIEKVEKELSELDSESPSAEVLQAEKQELQAQRKGVLWAQNSAYESDDFPQWDEDVDGVTLGALRASAYGNIQNDLEQDPDAGSGTSAILLIAEGTVEAPYIDDSMTDAQRAGAVGQLHPFYQKWAEARVNELMDPEKGNGESSEN